MQSLILHHQRYCPSLGGNDRTAQRDCIQHELLFRGLFHALCAEVPRRLALSIPQTAENGQHDRRPFGIALQSNITCYNHSLCQIASETLAFHVTHRRRAVCVPGGKSQARHLRTKWQLLQARSTAYQASRLTSHHF